MHCRGSLLDMSTVIMLILILYFRESPWWSVKMHGTNRVTNVVILNRDTDGSRLNNFEVRVGFSTTDFQANDLCGSFPGSSTDSAIHDVKVTI